MKANDEPKKAGTLAPVIKMYKSVPVPAVNKAVDVLNPVRIGTKIVAPNIANTCWKLNGIHFARGGLSPGIRTLELLSAITTPFLIELNYYITFIALLLALGASPLFFS